MRFNVKDKILLFLKVHLGVDVTLIGDFKRDITKIIVYLIKNRKIVIRFFNKIRLDRKAEKYYKENILYELKDEIKNILLINTRDYLGGPPRITYSLHKKYKEMGYNSKIFVKESRTDDENVSIISINDKLTSMKDFKNADVIHLHNIHGGYFNIKQLPEISSLKPVIWTLHDVWAFTGHCGVSYDCRMWEKGCKNCPYFSKYGSIKKKSAFLIWNLKKKIYNNSHLTIVCPSNWLKNKVDKSILNKFDIRVIYNGLDYKIFHKRDKFEVRDYLKLPKNKKILLFCAYGGKDNILKGGDYINEIVRHFKNDKNIVFLCVGSKNPQSNSNWMERGWIENEEIMSMYYSASDLLIYPSLQDNLPFVVLESMACGTPVIAFKSGGVPEIIEHNETGYLAEYKNTRDMIKGINLFLSDESKHKKASLKSINIIKNKFSIDTMAQKYINLYKEKIVRKM